MASIPVQIVLTLRHWDLSSPRPLPCRRIDSGKCVEGRCVADALEPFGQSKVLISFPHRISGIVTQAWPLRKVGGLNHKGITFPAAPWIAHPLTDTAVKVLSMI